MQEPGPTASPPTDSPPIPTTSGTNPPGNPGGGSDGLSTGATIGVAVGVSAVALIALALGLFFLFRRRRRRYDIKTSVVAETVDAPYLRSQDPPKYGYHQPSPELYQSHVAGPQELDTSHGVSEMSETTAARQRSPVELPSHVVGEI